jgi:L,D-transpeptidase ErfK/SrfK
MRILYACILWTLTVCAVFAQPEIHINIPEYTLRLIDNNQLVKTYPIAVGTPYEQTPAGSFKIIVKEINPTWYPGTNFFDRTPVPPGPDNPLGSRWMEFKPVYGIHGTNKDWDINYPVSGGCIRMQDKDAQELYELVEIDTPVIITYETMILTEKPDGLYIKLFPDIYDKQPGGSERLNGLLAAYSVKYDIKSFNLPAAIPYHTVFEAKIADLKDRQKVR